ncbi:MAG: hypothetical protein ACI9DF_002191 [Verrucomicrobiales bacterium]|jgi:hypothetical protein
MMNRSVIMRCLLISVSALLMGHAEETGFKPIFDGKSLAGWEAFPGETSTAWSVKAGVIHGASDGGPESYLGYTSAQFADFELKLEYRFLSEEANSGVQVRSMLPDEKSKRLRGYHVDFGHVGIGHKVLGAWDWHGSRRGDTLVNRGQSATFDKEGKRTLTDLKDTVKPSDVKKQDWNEVHIVAKGERMYFKINGKLASEVIDHDPKEMISKGYFGFQLHSGDEMIVEFRNIRVKTL